MTWRLRKSETNGDECQSIGTMEAAPEARTYAEIRDKNYAIAV
jgi:hypothetical protein